MPSAPTSSAEFFDLIKKSGIVPPEKLASVSDLTLPKEPQKAAAALVAQGLMTRFQAAQLLAGRHRGFKIGPYTVLDLLGRGGMGAVYLAEHGALNRKVAIKVLVTGKDENQKLAFVRFQREARAAAALDHPNIVRIHDVAQVGGVPFLVMEYVEGETLQHRLDRAGPLPASTAVEYIAQAAAGLQHAHEKGLVHRDIKPGNLIFDKTGTIKILDMGLARSVHTSDQVTEKLDKGAVVGTADFIAPEQAINNSSVDIRADIYSLGATLYSLIAGKPPFEGNTTQKLLQHQLRSAPSLAALDATLPEGLSHVVEKMLAKKPAERYQTPAEVLGALTPWMGASSRVIIGITNTSMAGDEALQATLSGIRRKGSSGRLSDSNQVDLEGGKETAAIASSQTRRQRREPEPSWIKHRKPLAIGLGAALVAGICFGAWLAFGRGEKATAQTQPGPGSNHQAVDPGASSQDAGRHQTLSVEPALSVTLNPNRTTPVSAPIRPTPEPAPKPPAPVETVLFSLDPAALPIFKTTKQGFEYISGDASPRIRGVAYGGYKKETVNTWECGPIAGLKALGFANLNEVKSAQLVVELESDNGLKQKLDPQQKVRLSVVYRTAGKGQGKVTFQTYGDWLTVKSANLPNSNNAWKTVELVTARGDKPIRGVIDITETGAGNVLYLRSIAVTTTNEPATPSSLQSPPPSQPAPPVNLSAWVEGRTVFSLDAGTLQPFRVQKEKQKRVEGDDESLPAGIGCQAWKDNSAAEFRCARVDDVLALMVANLTDPPSGQFYFELEKHIQVLLRPGVPYRVKVKYLTRNETKSTVMVQVTPGYKPISSMRLPETGGQWRTAEVTFTRPAADDNVEVRMVIDNNSVGERNELWVRTVEIVELVPPN